MFSFKAESARHKALPRRGSFGAHRAAVAIKGPDGDIIAKGVTAYDAADVQRLAGAHSDDIEARLGYRGRPAIIHRDDLVLGS